jgi:hypothetical protein
MASAGKSAAAGDPRKPTEQEDEIARDAKLLVQEHGDQAETVAAHRADALFRAGDSAAGARWLKVFQRIAGTHARGARRQAK